MIEPGGERAGLHHEGCALVNPGVRVRDVEVIYVGWQVLRRTTYDLPRRDEGWTSAQREYDDV